MLYHIKVILLLLPFFPFWHSILFAQTASSQLLQDKRIHDFGTIKEKDGKVSHTFVFTNTGKVPARISGVFSGCGCTSTAYTQTPISPGGTGKLTVTFNPAHRPGSFSKEVVVLFNTNKNFTRLWVKGDVIPATRPVGEDHPYALGKGLHSSLRVLPFGKVAKGQHKEITLFYANDTANEMDVCFLAEGQHANLSFTNPKKLPPKQRGKLVFRYTGSSKPKGAVTFNVYPFINGLKLSKPIIVKAEEV